MSVIPTMEDVITTVPMKLVAIIVRVLLVGYLMKTCMDVQVGI